MAFAERRQARAYYVVERGDRARRLLLAGRPREGVRALSAVASLAFRWPQAGFFPEIASRQQDAADLRGCFHQGWTPTYGLAHPLIAGLWGIEPDAQHDAVAVRPSAPADWSSMALDGLRCGSHEVSFLWRRHSDGQELICRQRGPALNLTVAFQVPAEDGRSEIRIDGKPVPRRHRRHTSSLGRTWVEVAKRVAQDQEATLEFHWAGESATARAAEFLDRLELDENDRPDIRSPVLHPARKTFRARAATASDPSLGRLVLYCGFLAPPFSNGSDLLVRHIPANYAVRRPDRLLELLPGARALVLTDQQDAVLSPELTLAIETYVKNGGKLLFFCYWSAAWGRGFYTTYSSLARTDLANLLPLRFEAAIDSTAGLQLEGPGAELWSDLPWQEAPPLDFNRASLRESAVRWARAATGAPVAASWSVGQGQVVAIGADCFGFGYGTLVHWTGQRLFLRRALDWLLDYS
jgi:hypothetical protein